MCEDIKRTLYLFPFHFALNYIGRICYLLLLILLLNKVLDLVEDLELRASVHLEERRDIGGDRRLEDKGVDEQIGEHAHDELAVHAVRDSAMAGDDVCKVLDVEGALYAAGKEPAERGYEGGEGGEGDRVHEDGGRNELVSKGREGARDKGGVHRAGGDLPAVEVCLGAREPGEAHEERAKADRPQEGRERAADEALPGLLGAELYEGRVAEEGTKDKGEDVVHDDEGGGEEEPVEAAEDVGDPEGGLDDDVDDEEVGPSVLLQLLLVLAGLEGEDKGDKDEAVGAEADEVVVAREDADGLAQGEELLGEGRDEDAPQDEVEGDKVEGPAHALDGVGRGELGLGDEEDVLELLEHGGHEGHDEGYAGKVPQVHDSEEGTHHGEGRPRAGDPRALLCLAGGLFVLSLGNVLNRFCGGLDVITLLLFSVTDFVLHLLLLVVVLLFCFYVFKIII